MLTNPTIETLKSLKVYGMLEALEEQQQTPAVQGLSFVPRLIEELRIAHGDGSYLKFLKTLSKAALIVLDDWGLTALATQDRADLLEILDDRVNTGSTLIASQLPIDKWHAYLGEPTVADAILDRLVHHSHRIELKVPGESMRKTRAPADA